MSDLLGDPDITNIRMLNNDILIKLKPWGEVRKTTIFVQETPQDDKFQYFTVMAKSPRVTDVEVGDVVIVPWTKVTPAFPAIMNGQKQKFGITCVTEVFAVIEDD